MLFFYLFFPALFLRSSLCSLLSVTFSPPQVNLYKSIFCLSVLSFLKSRERKSWSSRELSRKLLVASVFQLHHHHVILVCTFLTGFKSIYFLGDIKCIASVIPTLLKALLEIKNLFNHQQNIITIQYILKLTDVKKTC